VELELDRREDVPTNFSELSLGSWQAYWSRNDCGERYQ